MSSSSPAYCPDVHETSSPVTAGHGASVHLEIDPALIEPIYSRRCGYWLHVLFAVVWGFSTLGSLWETLFPSDKFAQTFDERIHANVSDYWTGPWSLLTASSLFAYICWVLADKKATTEPTNSFKHLMIFCWIFSLLFAADLFRIFLNYNLYAKYDGVIYESVVYYLIFLLFVPLFAYIPAAIMTNPDDSKWCCCRCLLFLKPWKRETIIPVYHQYKRESGQ